MLESEADKNKAPISKLQMDCFLCILSYFDTKLNNYAKNSRYMVLLNECFVFGFVVVFLFLYFLSHWF